MSRPKGNRDAAYEAKRQGLLHRMTERLLDREGGPLSLRDLAAAGEVTVPTLRHYFGGRYEVIDAIFEECLRLGRQGLDAQATSELPFAASIEAYALSLTRALAQARTRLGDLFAVSLAEGFLDPQVGASTRRHVIDPTIDALEARLAQHIGRGEMIDADPRSAALMLLSPILLASLHQKQLQGASGPGGRPLSMDGLAANLTQAFVRAFASP